MPVSFYQIGIDRLEVAHSLMNATPITWAKIKIITSLPLTRRQLVYDSLLPILSLPGRVYSSFAHSAWPISLTMSKIPSQIFAVFVNDHRPK